MLVAIKVTEAGDKLLQVGKGIDDALGQLQHCIIAADSTLQGRLLFKMVSGAMVMLSCTCLLFQ